MAAARVYPTTLTQFAIEVLGNTLMIEARAAPPSRIFSAGGSLALTAPNIDVAGALYAPLGQIALTASNRVELRDGALVSTALVDDVTLFGQTQAGLDWVFPFPNNRLQIINELPGKAVSLSAPEVVAAAGSRVDLSGGGKLEAFEFIAGPGGSRDYLSAENAGDAFVILPADALRAAPYDPSISMPYAADTGVYLSGIDGVPPGTYAVLPARYALLPGALLVTPQHELRDMVPGEVRYDIDGAPIVAGRFTVLGTTKGDSRWAGFKIQPGEFARQRSEYALTDADKFFKGRSGPLPGDGGSVSVVAQRALSINGNVKATAASGGRAGSANLVADRLAVIAAGAQEQAGFVNLTDAQLRGVDVGSLVLGAKRLVTSGGERLDVSASQVLVDAGAQIGGPEVILAGRQVVVRGGAVVDVTSEETKRESGVVTATDGAAVLIASSRRLEVVPVSGGAADTGAVQIDAGARINADGTLAIEGPAGAVLDGELTVRGGTFSLGSNTIALGDTDATDAAVLDQRLLGSLGAANVNLAARRELRVYGDVALAAEQVTLDGPRIRSASDDAALRVTGERVTLSNIRGAAAPIGATAASTGGAAFVADEIRVGGGDVRVDGFADTALTAAQRVTGSGQAVLASAGALTVTTPLVTAQSGADLTLQSSRELTIAPSAPPPPTTAAPQIGGAVRLRGDSVSVASTVTATSGVIDVAATRDVSIAGSGKLDVSGTQVTLGSKQAQLSGGRLAIRSAEGNVSVADGSSLTVAAGGAAVHAGRIELAAGRGTVAVAGDLIGGADAQLAIDAASVDLGAVNAIAEKGRFDGQRDYRVRTGDVVLAADQTLTAQRITLTADAGRAVIDAAVHISGDAGAARISAANGVRVGGTVYADHAADLTLASPSGVLELDGAGRIALSGGDLTARTAFTADAPQRIRLAGTIDADRTIVDLVHTVDVADGTFDGADQALLANDLTTRFSGLEAIRAQLPADTLVASSVELRANGGLRITDAWDLFGWRFADLPGTLTLRSAGDVALNADISDGFGTQLIEYLGATFPVTRPLAGPSWGYTFVGGADLTSADSLAVTKGAGSVRVGPAVTVRTGTGDVTVRAADALVFAGTDSSLYTAGQTTGTGGFSDVFSVAFMHDAQYPERGGAIDVNVGGNVVGARSQQLITPFMARFGGAFFDARIPVAVGVAFDNFGARTIEQNVGSFGGGAVRIVAGGDIRELTVVAPDTLQHAGDVRDTLGTSSFDVTFTDNSYLRRGTTTLDVTSRGNIVGGLYYLGSGAATLTSEAAIKPDASGLGTLLATSDASFDVTARQGLYIESMFNPTLLPQSPNLQSAGESSYFFTYTDRARLAATSYGADVTFGNDVRKIRTSFDFPSELRADRALDVYPSTVVATALTGDINVLGGMTLYSGQGGVGLYASQNVTGPVIAPGTLFLSDADPALLPNPDRAAVDLAETELRLPRRGQGDNALLHASTPVHAGDATPSEIVAQHGAIDAPLLSVVSSESLRIAASSDVNLGRIDAQNIGAGDITSVVSGGDIRIRSDRNAQTGQVITNSRAISVGGPGEVQLVAGRSIDLGSSIGIETIGDLANQALANEGADVSVLAGNAGAPDVVAFVQRYLIDSTKYETRLLAFARDVTGAPAASLAEARAVFLAQPETVQRELIVTVFFSELKASGIAAAQVIAAKGTKDEIDAAYAPGQLAIETLFPASRDFSGDLALFFSRITTLDGGDIRLVVPGGIVNAGLATTSLSSKTPAELGIVAQGAGSIDVYAGKDVLVNQSRVFTLSGGDINIWSQQGNVDAGRGAKTALASPGLSAVLGENDSVLRIVPPSISGSGIAAAEGANGELPDIVLSTPNGIVDAGDAGIRTPGRLFTAATEFLGRDNVDVGSFVGAPVGTVSLSTDLAGVGNSAASASQDIAQAAVEANAAGASVSQSMSQAALGWLEVFLEGYGDGEQTCDAEKDPKCRSKVQ